MKFRPGFWKVIVCTALSTAAVSAQQPLAPKRVPHGRGEKAFFLYVGSFTGSAPNGRPDGEPPSKGIYVARFNAATGAASGPVLAAEVSNPTVLTVAPDGRHLYALTESSPESFVTAYSIDRRTGLLRALNRLPTGGSGTAYISLDRTGRFLLLANYGSASVTVLKIAHDGSLGNLTSFVQHAAQRTAAGEPLAAPHPHAAVASTSNRFVVVPDLGLNKILVYKFDDRQGMLVLPANVVDLAPGEGPRHFVFSRDGRFGYVIAQTTGNVDVFRWDEVSGTLSPVQTAKSFPANPDAVNMSAEIGITPNGKFLYESNRRTHGAQHALGPDSIVAYTVDRETAELTEVQDVDRAGSIPRCFAIDPTGSYMVVGGQQTNRIDVLRIDQESGKLSETGVFMPIHTPACMQFASPMR